MYEHQPPPFKGPLERLLQQPMEHGFLTMPF